jgi:hypothetical protein
MSNKNKSIWVEKSDGYLQHIPHYAIAEVIPPPKRYALPKIRLFSGNEIELSDEANLSAIVAFVEDK